MQDRRVVEQHQHVPSRPKMLGTIKNLASGQFERKTYTRGGSRLTLSGFKE